MAEFIKCWVSIDVLREDATLTADRVTKADGDDIEGEQHLVMVDRQPFGPTPIWLEAADVRRVFPTECER
jgi:hypothetical protein